SIAENIADLYARRQQCLIHVKTVHENLGAGEEAVFIETLSPIADRIFIEHTVPSWPDFALDYLSPDSLQERGAYGQNVQQKQVCAYPFYSLAINSDGTVSPCCVDWNRKLVLGNLNSDSLQEIWHGETLKHFRHMMLDGERTKHPVCGKCGQISHCSLDNIDVAASRLKECYT
ncbi:MAG: SPASM domain-containing protein, partial [Rickettsiales bacterium]|nr:SPASM domain-containing protein [Rickettsiales bacterium]